LANVIQAAASTYVDSEVIDYEPATSPGDGQIMWISVANVPFLNAIVDESADMADMPLFDPSKASLSNLQLAAMRRNCS
jgi:hypothetical protein